MAEPLLAVLAGEGIRLAPGVDAVDLPEVAALVLGEQSTECVADREIREEIDSPPSQADVDETLGADRSSLADEGCERPDGRRVGRDADTEARSLASLDARTDRERHVIVQ